MEIHITKHACDRVIKYINKIKTHKQARRYIRSKFNKLCKQDTYSGCPVVVHYSSNDALNISSKGHTFVFQVLKKNSVRIITYHYLQGSLRKKHLHKLTNKEAAYKNLERYKKKKGFYNPGPPD